MWLTNVSIQIFHLFWHPSAGRTSLNYLRKSNCCHKSTGANLWMSFSPSTAEIISREKLCEKWWWVFLRESQQTNIQSLQWIAEIWLSAQSLWWSMIILLQCFWYSDLNGPFHLLRLTWLGALIPRLWAPFRCSTSGQFGQIASLTTSNSPDDVQNLWIGNPWSERIYVWVFNGKILTTKLKFYFHKKFFPTK